MMREEGRGGCLFGWPSQVEGPGVSPPLTFYSSIPLSLSLFTSPGGLHHLIWINERSDLLSVHSDERIVFTQTASTCLHTSSF